MSSLLGSPAASLRAAAVFNVDITNVGSANVDDPNILGIVDIPNG
jgi:hypothetical protein